MHLLSLFHRKNPREMYLRNFIFGVEDSLVSTVGLLAGVSSADVTSRAVLAPGFVLIVVEGLSMGIGSFLTEETSSEIEGDEPKTIDAIRGGLTMFISYCMAGLIPLSPYLFFSGAKAIYLSVFLSLSGLGLLGCGTSIFYNRPKPWKRGLKMFILGGIAVFAGVVIGKIFHI